MAGRTIAFGRTWDSEEPLHAFGGLIETGSPVADLVVRRVDRLAERAGRLFRSGNGELYPDGLRLNVRGEASFDIREQGQIDWAAGPDWPGRFPPEMFSIVAGTSLAMLGDLPMHASAVELAGRGVLLCGPGGAGKSTLAAGLCGIGARLVSDDLTVFSALSAIPVMHLGKRSVRLFPEIAAAVAAPIEPAARCPRGKVLSCLPAVDPGRAIALDTVVLLEPSGRDAEPDGEEPVAATLLRSKFRPNWMRHLPGAGSRLSLLDSLASRTRILRFRTRPISSAGCLASIATELAELIHA